MSTVVSLCVNHHGTRVEAICNEHTELTWVRVVQHRACEGRYVRVTSCDRTSVRTETQAACSKWDTETENRPQRSVRIGRVCSHSPFATLGLATRHSSYALWRCLKLVLHAIRNASRVHSISPIAHPLYVCAADPGPREPLGMPVRKPFFALRAMVLSVRMRPVPVVFLLFAFSLQLSVQALSVLAPGVTGSVLGGRGYGRRMGGGPTLPNAGARVSAVRAGVLLYVEGSLAWREYQYPSNIHHVSISAYRNVCTERASCCAVFRNFPYPLLCEGCQYPEQCSGSLIHNVLMLAVLGDA